MEQSKVIFHKYRFVCVKFVSTVAEWVVGTDVERNGWGAMYLEKLIGHGVTSMSKAKELIEESGDLREWQIPKVAAKAMFATMAQKWRTYVSPM